MEKKAKLLIVEDEKPLRDLLHARLLYTSDAADEATE